MALIPKFLRSLKAGGFWYCSFFYGTEEHEGEFPFYYMTEEKLRKQLSPFEAMNGKEKQLLHYVSQKNIKMEDRYES